MTTDQKIARRKLSMLELAQELGNFSRACQVMGYSCQQFYEIRRNFQTFGADGRAMAGRTPAAVFAAGLAPAEPSSPSKAAFEKSPSRRKRPRRKEIPAATEQT